MIRTKIPKPQLICLGLLVLCHITRGTKRKPKQNWQEEAKKNREQQRQNGEGRRNQNKKIAQKTEEDRSFEERQRLQKTAIARKRQEELGLRQQILDAESAAKKEHALQQALQQEQEHRTRLENEVREVEQRRRQVQEQTEVLRAQEVLCAQGAQEVLRAAFAVGCTNSKISETEEWKKMLSLTQDTECRERLAKLLTEPSEALKCLSLGVASTDDSATARRSKKRGKKAERLHGRKGS